MRTVAALLTLLGTTGCSSDIEPEEAQATRTLIREGAVAREKAGGNELNPRIVRRFRPLAPPARAMSKMDEARVELGRVLYYDPRLSRTKDVSCNSCHPLADYGATHDSHSAGVEGKRGARNAPSVYNASRHFAQFWDGRAANVEEQAGGPMLNAAEMGMGDGPHVTSVLRAIKGYAPLFAAAFPGRDDPVSFENACAAIGTFERGLLTPSRWDRYLLGEKEILTPQEKEGARTFANLGCLVCHTGELIGGARLEKLGAAVPWPDQSDKGRADVTRRTTDEMVFKVPSLRNVAKTGPYFHDGSAATLEEAVRMMAHHQLDIDPSDTEVGAIMRTASSSVAAEPS